MKKIIQIVCLSSLLWACKHDPEPVVTSIVTDTVKTNPDVNVPVKVSYSKDVLPLVTSKCTPCHTEPDNQIRFDIKENAMKEIDKMIKRVQLPESDEDAMPLGGPALSANEISILTKWKSDGLQD